MKGSYYITCEVDLTLNNPYNFSISTDDPRVFAMIKDFANSVVEDRADELSRAKRAKDGNNCCG